MHQDFEAVPTGCWEYREKGSSFPSSPETATEPPEWQIFYREVVVWKRLQHPNIVPFLGVPSVVPPFEIICEWMENGRITEYVRKHPDVNPVDLVSESGFAVTVPYECSGAKIGSCGMW